RNTAVIGPPTTGRPAAFIWRTTPGPASNRNSRDPTVTATAGPCACGSGYGMPVPSSTTDVVSCAGFATGAAPAGGAGGALGDGAAHSAIARSGARRRLTGTPARPWP